MTTVALLGRRVEGRTARRETVGLLGSRREVVDLVGWAAGTDDGCTVGQESRGQDC